MNMLCEEKYYDRDFLWKEDYFSQKEIERFNKTIEFMPEVDSVVDIGCGNGLFLKYLRKKKPGLKLCGFDRSQEALKYVDEEKYQGNIDALPFADRSFDMVTCLEVIEHLPNEIYLKALSEVCRISKQYVLISVPYDENLKSNEVVCPQCKKSFNKNLHLHSFQEKYLVNLLTCCDYEFYRLTYLGEEVNYIFLSKIRSFFNKIPESKFCPFCGYEKSSKEDTKSGSYIKKIIKKIWPKKKRGRWIMVLYQRNDKDIKKN